MGSVSMNQEAESLNGSWTRAEVEKTLKGILKDSLVLDEDKIVSGASLVDDLGAESIDILDIGFRVWETFGVELPNKSIQEKVVQWRNLSALREILVRRYGVKLSPQDIRQFLTMGVPGVLGLLEEKQRITVNNGDAEALAEELADRLACDVGALGFRGALIDHDGIKKRFLENLSSPKIPEEILQLLSVGVLVDFITDRVNGEACG